MYGPFDVRVIGVPDPVIEHPADAVVRVVRSCISDADLHRYRSMAPTADGVSMGHESVGTVEDIGADVSTVRRGDLVIWNSGTVGGCQAEAVRVPLADATLAAAPITEDSPLIPSLLTLSDIYPTGYHAAVTGGVGPDRTVTVIGDGAVGLLAVLSAKQLGAQRIVLMCQHKDRITLGREFGATDVVVERGAEGISAVRDLTRGVGTHVVIETSGLISAYEQALCVVRTGGVISRVGVPQYENAPAGFTSLLGPNITVTGGPAPVHAYFDTLLPDVLGGRVDPGKVFDCEIGLDSVPDGYRAMDARQTLGILVRP